MSQAVTYCFENQSPREESANSITHGAGAALSVAATAVLVTNAALHGSALKVVSFSVFGFSLCLLYTVSALYHGIRKPAIKRIFHIFDHSAIFVLIAGTYTPVTLVAIQGGWGWSLFGIAWGAALVGTVATLLFFEKARYFNIGLYIALGWLIVIAVPRLINLFSAAALIWLVLGGLCYTAGVLFYRADKMRYHHMIWHLFVIAGSVCHFFMMTAL